MTIATVTSPAKIARDLKVLERNSCFKLLTIRSESDLQQATTVLEQLALIDDPNVEIFMAMLADRIEAFEDKHYPVAKATPAEMLQFFMSTHGLSQSDLSEIARQSHISEMASGKRSIGIAHAKAFGKRFNADPALFLDL